MRIVARALEAHREDLERGALLSIDEGGTRVRMLPLKGFAGSFVATIQLLPTFARSGVVGVREDVRLDEWLSLMQFVA